MIVICDLSTLHYIILEETLISNIDYSIQPLLFTHCFYSTYLVVENSFSCYYIVQLDCAT